MNKRKLGAEKEEIAVNFLKEQGYHILCQNYYAKAGEIDIIAKQKEYLVFIEVKYRNNESKGTPEEAITPRKIRRMIQVAKYYLKENYDSDEIACRFDVITILENNIRLIQDAFDSYNDI